MVEEASKLSANHQEEKENESFQLPQIPERPDPEDPAYEQCTLV